MRSDGTHDTAAPLECCDRCRTAELSRRAGRRPNIQFSQTAATGSVEMRRPDGTEIAKLVREGRGWVVASVIDGINVDLEYGAFSNIPRSELIDDIACAYTAAWKLGRVS